MTITEYCCGFLFTDGLYGAKHVLLINKMRPKWQAGKLNGIGGHIETGETPQSAQVREFEEETGLRIERWSPVAVLSGRGFRIHFFASHVDKETFDSAETKTDEVILGVLAESIKRLHVLPNLLVLIPLALDTSGIVKPVQLLDEREPKLGSSAVSAAYPAANADDDARAAFGHSLATERWAVRQNELSLRHRQSKLMAFQTRQAGYLEKAADCETTAAYYLALFRHNEEHMSRIIAGQEKLQ